MEAKKKSIDNNALKALVPLGALSPAHLEGLLKKTAFETIAGGDFVVRHGERDRKHVYLMEGRVELLDRNLAPVGTLIAGTDMARHPIAQRQPRLFSVRAAGPVVVVRVDSDLLDVLLTWDQSSGYDVEELGGDSGEDWLTRLLQTETFRQLSPEQIQQLITRMEPVDCAAGDVIVREGDTADYFYIIKHGRVAITRRDAGANADVRLAELSDGAAFGEEGLVSGEPRNATVTAQTDGSLMRMHKADFNALLGTSQLATIDYPTALARVRAGARWVDVRLPGEYANLRLPDSLNVPVAEIRSRGGEFEQGRAYVLYCETGRRSAAAAYLLRQRGIDVEVLDHGLNAVPPDAMTGDWASADPVIPAAANDPAMSDSQAQLGELKTANAMLVADVAALERRLAEQKQSLETLKEEYESDLDTARRAMARAQEETQNVQRAQSRLQAAAKLAEQRLEEEKRKHEQEIYGLKRELRRSVPDVAEIQARENQELAARDARIHELDDALSRARHALDETLVQHAHVLAGREAQFKALEATSAEQQQTLACEIENLRQTGDERDRAVATARAHIAELETQVRERETALFEAQEELVSLEARSEERIQTLERSVEQLTGERDAKHQALERAITDASGLRSEMESITRDRVEPLENRIRELEAEREVLSVAMAQHSIAIDSTSEPPAESDVSGSATRTSSSTGAEFMFASRDDDWRAPLDMEDTDAVTTVSSDDDFEAEISRLQSEIDKETAVDVPPVPAIEIDELPDETDSGEPENIELFSSVEPAVDESAPAVLLDRVDRREFESVPRRPRLRRYALVVILVAAGAAAYLTGAFDSLSVFARARLESLRVTHTSEQGDATAAGDQPVPTGDQRPGASNPVPASDAGSKSHKLEAPGSGAPPTAATPDHPVSDSEPRSNGTKVRESVSATPVNVRRVFTDSLTSGGNGPMMVELSAGGFVMGSSAASANFNERPQRTVSLPVFSISQFEVTFQDYDRFAAATGRRLPSDHGWGRDTRPVINVSWDDARAYVHWLSDETGRDYGLPTEAEWEYAARAGAVTHFPWGNDIDKPGIHANCFGCGSEWDATRTAPVGRFRPNAVGLHDMTGNVMEWVDDCYIDNYRDAPVDGSAVTQPGCRSRVVRGGGYDSAPTALRCAARADRAAGTQLDDLGFRVVRRR